MDATDRRHHSIFAGCFLAMLATSFAFVTRAYLIGAPGLWPREFDLDKVQAQELFMAGVWPFAISIIACGFLTDKLGYRRTMFASAAAIAVYIVSAVAAKVVMATHADDEGSRRFAFELLYWGSVALGLGCGTVEGFINPLIATLFRTEKTKWLNRLHAGWPAGLIIGGVATIGLSPLVQRNWLVLVVLLALPVTAYVWVLMGERFPVHERVAAGTSYRRMLAEFGVIGCGLAAFLLLKQLTVVPGIMLPDLFAILLWVALVVVYWHFSKSWGRPMMLALCLLIMPQAICEIGTDSAITGIMEERLRAVELHPLWLLVFIGGVMFAVRASSAFFIKRFSPVAILCVCSACAGLGLYGLSDAVGLSDILLWAGFYAAANAFLWPTMLGVAAEQHPKGGALTLTALSGIGMFAVGIVGGPLIGAIQENVSRKNIERRFPGVYETISRSDRYVLGTYTAVHPDKLNALPVRQREEITRVIRRAKQKSLTRMAVFPALMLCGFLLMHRTFRKRGGYKAKDIHAADRAHEAELGL